MSATATPLELYGETLDSLRADHVIGAVGRLRSLTSELLDWLPEGIDGEQGEIGFPLLRGRLERCLAVAQPLLDFGGTRGVSAVSWMLQTLASLHGDSSNLIREPMISLALHDLSWTLLVDCLARDSFEPLPDLTAVVVPDPYEDVGVPLFSTPGIRHTNVFDRGADKTYLDWRDWLLGSELFSAMPHLASANRLADSIPEAELLTSLLFAATHAECFCAALGGRAGRRQLLIHLSRTECAIALAETFGVQPGQLPERLNELHALLVGPDHFRPRGPLVPN